MNLIDLVKNQLSSEATARLASLVGGGNAETQKAVSAAVPSVLAGLANLASTADGASRLTKSLEAVDPGLLGNLPGTLAGAEAGSLGTLGGTVLNQLFSGAVVAALTNALSRYSGLSPTSISKLLNYVLPVVLGALASQWKSRGAAPGSLPGMLSEQKGAIEQALPSGFSLRDVPGLGSPAPAPVPVPVPTTPARDAQRSAATPAPAREEGALPWWLLPLIGLLLLGLLGWWLLSRPGSATTATTAATSRATETTAKATGAATDKATEKEPGKPADKPTDKNDGAAKTPTKEGTKEGTKEPGKDAKE